MKNSSDLASRLNKRVTLQEEVATPDDAGGYSLAWEDVATFWAEIKPLPGGRGDGPFISMQQEGRGYAHVLMRYREGVTTAFRLVYGVRVFNIIHVTNPGESNEQLELLVGEGVAL